MPKSVIILGTGPSLALYKYKEGDVVWATANMGNAFIDKYVTLYFGMHGIDGNFYENTMNQDNFPLGDVVLKFDSEYFTSSVSYMIAFAIFHEYEEINIYGVDMSSKDEYINQRGSVMYWIGYARAKGIKVYLSSEVDKPCFLYGYEPGKNIKNKLKNMKQFAKKGIEVTESEVEKNQYLGMIQAIQLIELEL